MLVVNQVLSEMVTAVLLCLSLKVWTDLGQDVGISEEPSCGYCGDKCEPCGADCDGVNKPSLGAFLSPCCGVSKTVCFLLDQRNSFKYL